MYRPHPSVPTASTAAGISSSSSCTRPCHSWPQTSATWWPSSLTLCTPWLVGSPFPTWAHEGQVCLHCSDVRLQPSAVGAPAMALCDVRVAWPVPAYLRETACRVRPAITDNPCLVLHQTHGSGSGRSVHTCAVGSKLDLGGAVMGHQGLSASPRPAACLLADGMCTAWGTVTWSGSASSAERSMRLMPAGVPGGLTAGIADVFFRLPIIKHNYAWSGSVSAGLGLPATRLSVRSGSCHDG